MIECTWSPNMLVLNKKQNINKISNRKMDPYEKAPTFDGPEHLSIYGIILFYSILLYSILL